MKNVFVLAAALLAMAPVSRGEMFKDGEIVCFYGDSITHGGVYHKVIYDYYLTRFPDRKIHFCNVGIGGDSAGGAQGRFKEDITDRHPTAVAVMFGMNDIGRGSYVAAPNPQQLENQNRAVQHYAEDMDKIAARLKSEAGNPAVYYLTPTPFDDTVAFTNRPDGNFPGCNAALGQCAEVVRNLCAENHGTLVDFFSTIDGYNRFQQLKNPHFTIIGPDRVHPGAAGHLLMAWVFLKAQGADGLVSSARFDSQTLAPHPFTVNAELSGFKKLPNGVAFMLAEKALPFPVDPAVRWMLDSLPILSDLNREILAVTGLPAGNYLLKIDGQEVGTWTAETLAAGVNLALNEKTPQFQQAQRVREANAKRYNVERFLRDLAAERWFLGHQKVNPDDLNAVKVFSEAKTTNKSGYFEGKLAGYIKDWPKRAQFQKDLDDKTNELFGLRQPRPHAYELTRR